MKVEVFGGDPEDWLRQAQTHNIQIGLTREGDHICLDMGEHTYAWQIDMIPPIIKALRACANGTKMPLDVKGMVFRTSGDRICLMDEPPKKETTFIRGEPKLVITGGWNYSTTEDGARNLADRLEEVFNKLRPDVIADPTRDWRRQIAEPVRSVKSACEGGGVCSYRMAMGMLALYHMGLEPKPMYGAMLCRVGADDMLDVVSFCGPGNMAVIPNLYHAWVEVDGHIIDFSVGDWREDAGLMHAATADGHRPINFEIDLPDYVWRPAEELIGPWRPNATPPLGVMWYQRGVRITETHDEAACAEYFKQICMDGIWEARGEWPQVQAALPPRLIATRPPSRAQARRLRQMQKANGRRGLV